MRNPDRLDSFYEELKKMHKDKVPDWRFGQLILNFIRWYGDPFFLEEKGFLEKLREFITLIGKE